MIIKSIIVVPRPVIHPFLKPPAVGKRDASTNKKMQKMIFAPTSNFSFFCNTPTMCSTISV